MELDRASSFTCCCCPRFRRFVLPPFGFLSAPPEPSSDAPPVDRRPVSAKEPVF
jgi:hypothetical protein